MNLLTLYLQDFNRQYLSAPADRRCTAQEALKFLALAAAFVLAVFLWALASGP